MFLETVAEEEATGKIAEFYAKEKAHAGFVPESARCLSTRPDLPPLFDAFFEGVRAGFSLGARAWCLITLIAAKHLRSTYCSQVYGQRLQALEEPKDVILAIQRDHRNAGLPERDVAMLDYAERVIAEAHRISQDDIDRLRGHGFSDREICDIALCAALRSFISKFADATGAAPEPAFHDTDPAFRAAMTVGRRIAENREQRTENREKSILTSVLRHLTSDI
jgi:uncharacterized peroxidase-related enzyme